MQLSKNQQMQLNMIDLILRSASYEDMKNYLEQNQIVTELSGDTNFESSVFQAMRDEIINQQTLLEGYRNQLLCVEEDLHELITIMKEMHKVETYAESKLTNLALKHGIY